MVLDHVQEGYDQLVIFHCDDLIHILHQIRKDLVSRGLHRRAVRYRADNRKGNNFTLFHRSFQAGSSCGFHCNHFNIGVQELGQCRHTGCQSASAYRYQDVLYQRQILEDLHHDRALAGRNRRVIKGMYEGESLFFGQLQCVAAGLIIHIALQDHLRPIASGAVYLDQWRRSRHDDGRLAAVLLGCVCHALGMVPGGCSDQPSGALFLAHGADLVVSSTDLVGACRLHVLRLQIDLVAGYRAEIITVDQGCVVRYLSYDLGSLFKSFQCKHLLHLRRAPICV